MALKRSNENTERREKVCNLLLSRSLRRNRLDTRSDGVRGEGDAVAERGRVRKIVNHPSRPLHIQWSHNTAFDGIAQMTKITSRRESPKPGSHPGRSKRRFLQVDSALAVLGPTQRRFTMIIKNTRSPTVEVSCPLAISQELLQAERSMSSISSESLTDNYVCVCLRQLETSCIDLVATPQTIAYNQKRRDK